MANSTSDGGKVPSDFAKQRGNKDEVIIKRLLEGTTYRSISRELHVSLTTVTALAKGIDHSGV